MPSETRVLIVTGTFLPAVGGLEVATGRLAESLINMGLEVSLVTSQRSPDWPAQETMESGLVVTRLKQGSIRWIGTLLYLVRLFLYLWKNRKNYDIVHACFIDPTTLTAAVVKRFTGRPAICRLSGGDHTGDVQRMERSFFKTPIWWTLKSIDSFVALSERMVSELGRNGLERNRLCRIPNGADTEVFMPCDVADRENARSELEVTPAATMVVFVGRLSIEKGPRELIQAFEAVSKENPEAELWMLGDGPLRRELEEEISERGLEGKVKLCGNVADVREYLKAADVFVLPSLSEGMPNSLLEAMASGLACVATEVSGSEDIVEDGESGLLVAAGDVVALTEAILKLSISPELRSRLAVAARKRIENHFSLESVTREYVSLYERCLRP